MRFWFRRKYGLPPTDPRYLNMTDEGMLTDYWTHCYYDRPDEFEGGTDNFEEALAAMDTEMGVPPEDAHGLADDLEDISHGG